MGNTLHKEINVKLSVQMDNIEVIQKDMLVPIEFAVDSNGNPIEAFSKRKAVYRGYNLTLNGITVHNLALTDRMEYLLGERNSGFGVEILGPDDDKIYALTFVRLFYRVDYMEKYMKDIQTVFKQVFDVELEI